MTNEADDGLPGGRDGGTSADWAVPRRRRAGPLARRLPGSKSMTNRALILAALADGPTEITGPLVARDTLLMAGALAALGCRIEQSAGAWLVEPGPFGQPGQREPAAPREPGQPTRPHIAVDVGNAGTVLRFVPPVAALTSADVHVPRRRQDRRAPGGTAARGAARAGRRDLRDGTGAVPSWCAATAGWRAARSTLDASSSSQLVSGLLLAAARFGAGAQITHAGPAGAVRAAHRDDRARCCAPAGVDVRASREPARSRRRRRRRPGRWQVLARPDRGRASGHRA